MQASTPNMFLFLVFACLPLDLWYTEKSIEPFLFNYIYTSKDRLEVSNAVFT